MEIFNQLPTGMCNLISALVGAFVGVLGTLYVSERAAHRAAKETFRSAFADDLSILREIAITNGAGVFNFLKDVYPRHEAAYLEFRRSLGNRFFAKWVLRRHWMAYRGPYPEPPALPEEDAMYYRLAHFCSKTEAEEKQKREEAIHLIEELIA